MPDQKIRFDSHCTGYARLMPSRKGQVKGNHILDFKNCEIIVDYDKDNNLIGIEFLKGCTHKVNE